MEIKFAPRLVSAAPGFEVALIETPVANPPTSDELWAELTAVAAKIAEIPIENIRHRPAIDATRSVYKALGKEPNRYRPSAEALCRRIVNGKELYRTTTIVDLVNLVSLLSGHSIGAFDADRIEGDVLTLGAGEAGEPYEAIGRGMLNVENLPVYRDAVGGIGTPTSDNVRTQLSNSTSRLLITLNMYGQSELDRNEVVETLLMLLRKYASAPDNISVAYYKTTP